MLNGLHKAPASNKLTDFTTLILAIGAFLLSTSSAFATTKGLSQIVTPDLQDEWIFGTEIGLLTKEPFLLSVGFVNWSPHLNVDPQPYIEAGYYTEHHKVIVGAIHAGYKNEAILGYAYDFNERWRVQVDFQSGSENSSTIGFTCNVTRDFQFNPALYVNNGSKHDLFGYIVFTYTFHLWGREKENAPLAKPIQRVTGAK